MPNPEPELLAAVDLGSNSFHMIVCRIQDNQIVVLDRIREMVRLAAGINKKKILSAEVQSRALDCLTRFGQRLADIPPHNVRIVGTNTLRSAHNSHEFIVKAEQSLGHSIDVISGVEEARLIYLGVAHSLAVDDERRLVMDIGGGSTELIIGEQYQPVFLESLYMGCVSMSQRFFKKGRITRKKIAKAELAVQQELEPHIYRLSTFAWKNAIGASGTIRAVDKLVHHYGWAEHGITLQSMEQLLELMLESGHIDNYPFRELIEDRLPVFTGGFMILYSTFKALGIDVMRVADGALREGLIHDLLGRMHHEDIRDRSSLAIAVRYHTDQEQATRVAATARYCLAQVATDWQLDVDTDGQWLQWASILHESGIDIAHSNYHKHGAYIVEHSDMAGFSRQEQQRLAFLVLSHRRKLQLQESEKLPGYWQQSTIYLAIILRLAVILNRGRKDMTDNFDITASQQGIKLRFAEGWLEQNSLTHADLEQEIEYLQKIDFRLRIR